MFSCYVLYIISSEEIENVQNLDVTSVDFGRDGCADLSSIYSRLYVVCSLSGRKFPRPDSVISISPIFVELNNTITIQYVGEHCHDIS